MTIAAIGGLATFPVNASVLDDFSSAFSSGQRAAGIDVENDSIRSSSDRFYTNGIRLRAAASEKAIHLILGGETFRISQDEGAALPERLVRAMDGLQECSRYVAAACLRAIGRREGGLIAYRDQYGMHLASNMYTASDIKLLPAQIPPDDRPYAGWTYLGVSRQRIFLDDSEDYWELDAGCIGPCSRAEQIQKAWHRMPFINAPQPQGWSTQIGNEPVLQVIWNRRFAPAAWGCEEEGCSTEGQRFTDVAGSVSVQAGNVFATVGAGGILRLRIGGMRGYFAGQGIRRTLPSVATFRPSPLASKFAADTSATPASDEPELFVFMRSEVRLVAYNALIQGRLFGGPDPTAKDPKRVVADLETGVTLNRKRWSLVVSYVTRSTEVDAQPDDLFHHHWVSIRFQHDISH